MAGDSSLTEGEVFVLQLHPHWKTLLRPFFILIVTLAAALALLILLPAGADPPIVRIIIGAIALLLSIVFFAVPIARWRTTSYELTTRRLRLRSGIVSRSGR
jgi:membrane protein YdbS with pleckstrin-like domain